MTNEMKKVLDKVRKMVSLANNDAASAGERDNALRMSHALLAKHNLDMSAVTQEQADADRCDVAIKTRSRPWRRHVAHALSEMLFCKYFYRHAGNYDTHYFIGRKDNVAVAQYLLDYLLASIVKEAKARFSENAGSRTAFQKGATAEIWQRCQRLKAEAIAKDAPDAAPGTALVLASLYQTEADANTKYLAEQMAITALSKSKNRERNTGDHVAYREGRQYGSTVSLNRQVGTQHAAAALR